VSEDVLKDLQDAEADFDIGVGVKVLTDDFYHRIFQIITICRYEPLDNMLGIKEGINGDKIALNEILECP